MSREPCVLITGGGGMLANAFINKTQRILPRCPSAISIPRCSLDITDESAVLREIESIEPTIVINCAAYTKVDLAEQNEADASRINGDAVAILARACRQFGAKLVHFSTDYVFDGTLRRPLKPDDPVGPQCAYGRSKLLGEQLLQKENPKDWLIIRTAWLYGPGGPNFPQAILNAARAGKPLTVVDDQIGCPTFTQDLAQATVELIEKGATGIYHVVNDGETTWHDFATAILKEFHIDAPVARTTSAEWKKSRPNSAVRPSYSVLDLTPFERLTGHRPPNWADALKRYATTD